MAESYGGFCGAENIRSQAEALGVAQPIRNVSRLRVVIARTLAPWSMAPSEGVQIAAHELVRVHRGCGRVVQAVRAMR